MRIKICGITNLEDALVCSECGADALGFIFYRKSKRFIEFDQAQKIIKELPSFMMKVGVFVNEDFAKVNDVSQMIGLTSVQLHGEENPEYVKKILLPVIKSFRIKDKFDFSVLKEYPNCSFLLDTYSKDELGGTGKTFDWELIPIDIRKKIILAGGISLDNIEEICNDIKPAAIDVSSSIEDYPGKKNHTKLKRILNIVKRQEKIC